GGLFQQRQTHSIYQDYLIDDLAAVKSVPAPAPNDTVWLTDQIRVDPDFAVFGEASYDITEKLTGLVGARYYEAKNSLEGFYGFNENYFADFGTAFCEA